MTSPLPPVKGLGFRACGSPMTCFSGLVRPEKGLVPASFKLGFVLVSVPLTPKPINLGLRVRAGVV